MDSEQPTDREAGHRERAPGRPHLLIADAVRDLGGGERFVLDVATHLPSLGWTTTILAYPGSPLHRLARERRLPCLTARTRANGAPWTVLPLMARLRRAAVDLVLSVYDKDLRTVGLAAHLLGPAGPPVVHSRECDGPLKDRPWIRWFHLHVARRVLVNSEATRRSTLASAPWLPAERIELLPKGIDLTGFAELERAPVGCTPELRLGFLGQLNPRKRVAHLLEQLAGVQGNWSLRIAGRGPEEAALRQQVGTLGLGARVVFDGYVEDVPHWLSQIDALVLPSLEEGWGYALAEAAAAGRCVVAHAASSVPEVTPAAAGALLADPHTPDALRSAIEALLREGPAGWRTRGASLRSHATAQLGLDKMLRRLDTLLRSQLRRTH